jgi:hypothetical protein
MRLKNINSRFKHCAVQTAAGHIHQKTNERNWASTAYYKDSFTFIHETSEDLTGNTNISALKFSRIVSFRMRTTRNTQTVHSAGKLHIYSEKKSSNSYENKEIQRVLEREPPF